MSAILDSLLSHQIGIERAKSGESFKIIADLKPLDDQILRIINALPENYTQRQLNAALKEISVITKKFYADVMQSQYAKIGVEAVGVEVPFATETVNTFLNPKKEVIKSPSQKSVFKKAEKKLFQGKLISQWVTDLGTDKINRVSKSVRNAAIDNAEVSKLSSTAKSSINTANKNSKAVTRSTVGQYTNQSRDDTYTINDDKAKLIVWSSVLDSGTTVICAARSNKLYNAKTKEPIGHNNLYDGGPGVIHFGCRSFAVPTSDNGIITSGPGKDEKYSTGTRTAVGAKSGYERGGDQNTRGQRAKLPTDSNQLKKNLIPANKDYDTWMRTQPRAFVEDSLGVGKARLFLDQKVPLDSFVTPAGRELTLSEINVNLAG